MQCLSDKKCVPCKGGVPPLEEAVQKQLGKEVPKWTVERGHHLLREFTFSNFVKALAFVNKIAVIAEEEGHHPDIYLAFGKVRIEIWTHKIDGLTESDFILAAKIDKLEA